jgi:hypothetical protein
MIKIGIFTVYDRKAEVYNTPYFQANEAVAMRGFSDMANDKSTPIHNHPADFILFYLGQFDTREGKFEIFDISKEVCSGLSVIRQTGKEETNNA